MPATGQARPAPRRSLKPPRAGSEAVRPQTAGARPALLAIKAAHTLVWLSIESCMVYVLYAGLANRTDRRGGGAGARVGFGRLGFSGHGIRRLPPQFFAAL